MSSNASVADRLKGTVQALSDRPFAAELAHLLSPGTEEELERRRAHLLGLLLVAAVSSAKHVTGLTDGSAQYTVYGLAIALTAIAGGIAPAAVAAMAAVLLAGSAGGSSLFSAAGVLFALEAAGLAVVVGASSRRLRESLARLSVVDRSNATLTQELGRARISHDAFVHLEEIAADAAVFVVNAHGLIVEWPQSATRMYGFTAEQMLGADSNAILGEPWRPAGVDPLRVADASGGSALRTSVHRRADGTPVHVEFAIRPCGAHGREHFTVAVEDLSRRRETEAFRDAALRAQTALQRAADEARTQLETLEALTDPALSIVSGTGAVDELVDRLRSAVRAEGIALVQVGRNGTHVVAAAGLQPTTNGRSGAAVGGAADSRLALVHNDPVRVAQVSAVQWPETVSSIVVVPVWQSGPVSFRIEVVNERRAAATEWDLALARIVADRLASAMRLHARTDSADAVA